MFKKRIILVSLILILTGTFISIVGFGTADFNYNQLKESVDEDVWYQTIHIKNDNVWYGIGLGDNVSLFVIGNSD